jgi:esterase
MPLLHHSILPSQSPASPRTILLLHGILGTGSNLRGLGQALLAVDPSAQCVFVDLRMHGRSQGFAPPHTVAACADDLHALAAALPSTPTEVIGHSFGGKVALAYAQKRPDLQRIALIDSSPFLRADRHGSEQTMAVIAMLERLPATFGTRAAFVEHVHAQGFSRMIADWLAMNLDRTDAGFRFRLDLTAIRSLLDDYFAHDLWPVLAHSQARVDLVIGGRSEVWREADMVRAQRLSAEQPERVRVHVLPEAGHWVHVDDPQGLKAALTSA